MRGTRPRAYEVRLLRRLLDVARARRQRLGLRSRMPIRILDLGTGYGRDLAWLRRQRGVRVIGMDYSMVMLRAGSDGPVVQMDVQALGFRTGRFHAVRAQALFHHLPPRPANAAMGEVARVLKPGGVLSIFVRHGTRRGMFREGRLGARYFHYFTLRRLRALLTRHRLRLIECEQLIASNRVPCLAALAEKPLPAR